MPEMTYRDAINRVLHQEMERDPNIVVFGEDVAEYEGSFKVTRGLLDKFGHKRVIDTPISEAGIVGAATGMALGGLRPVPELMTVNFAFVAMDQICNHLAVMRYMFGGQCTLPVTIRMPGGGGHQLGAQHSHSLEAFFVHTPGLWVATPATPADAAALLVTSIRCDDPVVFLEHEGLYNSKGEVPEELPDVPLGQAAVRREGSDITLVGYSAMALVVEQAAELLKDNDIEAEVIDLRTLRPLDIDTVARSVAKTHRAIVVEESKPMCGIAAEVSSRIHERCFGQLDAPVRRISNADVPAPYAKDLEQSAIPNPEDVAAAAREMLGKG
jgi:pyruvate dehydrogenase E1 component beta subunit